MKNCPYCDNPINEHWSYCHHCNKPLIVNVKNQDHFLNRQSYNDKIDYNFQYLYSNYETKTNRSLFDVSLNIDEHFEAKIQEIDKTIDNYIKSGEPIGILLFEKASFYYLKKNYDLALKTLENALNNFQAAADVLNIAISHNEIGLIQEDLGYYENSLYHFEKSIDFLIKISNSNKLIKVYNNIANVYYLLNDIEHSYEYYDKALKLAVKENLITEEIKTSSNLVEILFNLEDYDKIDKILNRNLEYFRQIGDPYGIIITLTKIGKLDYLIGPDKFNSSIKNLLEALEIVNRIKITEKFSIENKAKLEWECLFYLGKLNLSLNNYTEAEYYFFRSLEAIRMSEIGGNVIQESIVLEGLGNLFESKGDFKKSIEYFKLAGEIYYKFGDDFNYAELKYKIAQILLKFDQLESIKNFEEALDLFKDLNYIKRVAEILHKLGDIYVNRQVVELAISYFQQAKDFFMDLKDDFNVKLINEKIHSLDDSSTNYN